MLHHSRPRVFPIEKPKKSEMFSSQVFHQNKTKKLFLCMFRAHLFYTTLFLGTHFFTLLYNNVIFDAHFIFYLYTIAANCLLHLTKTKNLIVTYFTALIYRQ